MTAECHVTLVLAWNAEPIAGRLAVEGRQAREFFGYVQLIAELESVRRCVPADDAPSPSCP